jgi:hypothetical protein
MTTVKAFNEMMGQFLDELNATFPEEEAVKTVKEAPRDRSTFENFMKDIGPFATKLMQKDDGFFCDENPFVKNLNLTAIWASPEATENTKQAIWQYLQTMYILGNTINMFPPETLSMIESAAEACAKNMQNQAGAGAVVDEQALMAGMNNMLSQMLGGGANPFGAAPRQNPKVKGPARRKK